MVKRIWPFYFASGDFSEKDKFFSFGVCVRNKGIFQFYKTKRNNLSIALGGKSLHEVPATPVDLSDALVRVMYSKKRGLEFADW